MNYKDDTIKINENLPLVYTEANIPWTDMIVEDMHVIVFADKYPVTKGHVLVVPKYNSMRNLYEALQVATNTGKQMFDSFEIDGFNVGINYGEAAGQTVLWPHVHLIPRRKGDMEDPRGGVRHVIPEKGNYKLETYKGDSND